MNILPPAGPARYRQIAMLVVLLSVLVYFGRGLLFPSTADGSAEASNPASEDSLKPLQAGAMPEPLSMASLDPVASSPAAGRNPFRFGTPPPPPPPPFTPQPPPPPYTPQPVPTPVDTGPPEPPPIQVRFCGLIQPRPTDKPRAILYDPAGKILAGGTEGGIVDGRYRVVRIGETSLIIEYLDGRGRRQIPKTC